MCALFKCSIKSSVGAGIWFSGQSGGLARQRGDPGSIFGRDGLFTFWMYSPSAVSVFGMDMCAIQKFLFHLILISIRNQSINQSIKS
jgi:hypothetical protein